MEWLLGKVDPGSEEITRGVVYRYHRYLKLPLVYT